jgi:hypothetical protein
MANSCYEGLPAVNPVAHVQAVGSPSLIESGVAFGAPPLNCCVVNDYNGMPMVDAVPINGLLRRRAPNC